MILISFVFHTKYNNDYTFIHPLLGKSTRYSSQFFHSGCFFTCSFTKNGVPHGGPKCAKNDICFANALSTTLASYAPTGLYGHSAPPLPLSA